MSRQVADISFGIPVQSGHSYAIHALKTILTYCSTAREIVVSLSPEDWRMSEDIQALESPAVRVIYQKKALSMKDHFEAVLRDLSGEWISILGQDDGILPTFDEVTRRAMSAMPGLRAYVFDRAYYWWPGTSGDKPGMGRIDVSERSKCWVKDSRREIQSVLEGKRQHYHLPQLYTNCLVHASVIQELRVGQTGNFFQEWSPDLFSGVAIASHLPTYGYSGYPAFWTGTSSTSAGLRLKHLSRERRRDNMEEMLKASSFSADELGPLSFSEYFLVRSSALWTYGTLQTVEESEKFPAARETAYASAYAENLPLVCHIFGKSRDEARRNRKLLLYGTGDLDNRRRRFLNAVFRRLPALLWVRFRSPVIRRFPFSHRCLRTSSNQLSTVRDASSFVQRSWK